MGLVDIGWRCRMLYGLDSNGSPWIGLRSGGEVSDQVTLPESTTELFHYALADTKSPSGSYSVNWDDMLGLHWLDPVHSAIQIWVEVSLCQEPFSIWITMHLPVVIPLQILR